ncbi:MAG: hypothetical protein WC635_03705 [Bacteriovorax sp.]|jgi:hypothetical protein
MNKKIILLFVVMLLCAGAWWWKAHSAHGSQVKKSSRSAQVLSLQGNILEEDRKKFESYFKSEVLQNKHWPEINDYTIGAVQLVNKTNARELFKLANSNAKSLTICLKKDFCGMEKRNDDDSYFDEAKTPGHIFLGRHLEILLESLRLYSDLKNDLDWELIRDLTDSENEKIQLLALEIIKDYDSRGSETEALLDIAEDYKGNAKAGAFEKIANRESLKDQSLLVNALEKSFSLDDPHTVISVVEKIKKMNLSETDIARVSKTLCRFKENGNDDPNWKMIKYDMKKLADLEKICH